jgi:hypothetical protein
LIILVWLHEKIADLLLWLCSIRVVIQTGSNLRMNRVDDWNIQSKI